MIDIKELSIGNWVNYRPGWKDEEIGQIVYESGTGFPVKIEMMYFCQGEGLVQYNDGQNDGIEACDYELFPIEITSEILEKNGFRYNDMPLIQGWEQFGLTLYHGGNGYLINCGQNVAMKINAVHQLQNALTLCGIDKEIEL